MSKFGLIINRKCDVDAANLDLQLLKKSFRSSSFVFIVILNLSFKFNKM